MKITRDGDIALVEEPTVLARVLGTLAKLTATEMLTMSGSLKPFISKSEAYRMYGRGKVDKWISEGHLSIGQDEVGTSSKMRINRNEIEALAQADDLVQYQIMKDNEARSEKKATKRAAGAAR